MILPASYANGFAPRDGEPLYPELSNRCVFAASPCLGPTGSTLRDWSGFANHVALQGGAAFSLDQRHNVLFDGSNDRIDCGTPAFTAANTLSIFAFIKPTAVSGSQKSIVASIDSTGNIGRALRKHTSAVEWVIASSGGFRLWRTTTGLLSSRWTPVCVIAAGTSEPLVYVDGILRSVTLVAQAGSIAVPPAQPLAIGYDGGNIQTLYNFDGGVAEVRIYDTSPTAKEVILLSSEIGASHKLAPRRRSSVQVAAFNRRRRLLVGAGS